MNRYKKYTLWFFALIIMLVLLFLADVSLGSVFIPAGEFIKMITGSAPNPNYEKIIFLFRLPKAVTAIFAGSALSICGLMMQSLFRNPMAGPSVLGITAGSGIGVALVLL